MKKLSLILLGLIGGAWGAEEFIISYSAKVKNDILSGEQYKVSKAISKKGTRGLKSGKYKVYKTCHILTEEQFEEEGGQESLYTFLKTHKNEVLDCLYGNGVEIYDEVVSKNLNAKTKTILKIPPTRVIAQPKNEGVEINVLEQSFEDRRKKWKIK